MPVHINKASEIWPCYSLARSLFKHIDFLLIISLLFIHFPYPAVSTLLLQGKYRYYRYLNLAEEI